MAYQLIVPFFLLFSFFSFSDEGGCFKSQELNKIISEYLVSECSEFPEKVEIYRIKIKKDYLEVFAKDTSRLKVTYFIFEGKELKLTNNPFGQPSSKIERLYIKNVEKLKFNTPPTFDSISRFINIPSLPFSYKNIHLFDHLYIKLIVKNETNIDLSSSKSRGVDLLLKHEESLREQVLIKLGENKEVTVSSYANNETKKIHDLYIQGKENFNYEYLKIHYLHSNLLKLSVMSKRVSISRVRFNQKFNILKNTQIDTLSFYYTTLQEKLEVSQSDAIISKVFLQGFKNDQEIEKLISSINYISNVIKEVKVLGTLNAKMFNQILKFENLEKLDAYELFIEKLNKGEKLVPNMT